MLWAPFCSCLGPWRHLKVARERKKRVPEKHHKTTPEPARKSLPNDLQTELTPLAFLVLWEVWTPLWSRMGPESPLSPILVDLGIHFSLFFGFVACFWNAFHEFIVEMPMCSSLCSASITSALLPIPIQRSRGFSAALSFESYVSAYPPPSPPHTWLVFYALLRKCSLLSLRGPTGKSACGYFRLEVYLAS